MRYFTMAWWSGYQIESTDDASDKYNTHFESIRDKLPPDLLTLEDSAPLHDSRLRELQLSDRTLVIVFESYEGNERFVLTYSGVDRFMSFADPEIGLAGPFGYGDLGYSEVDVLPDGAYEHRFLFSSGIEFCVIFRGFKFQRENTHRTHKPLAES